MSALKSAAKSATSYQHWFGPSTFLRCPYRPDFTGTDIGLVDAPYCGGNPIENTQYLGPQAVRDRSMAGCGALHLHVFHGLINLVF